ncbi:hypothetical protein OH76DRAFT_697830 [Lentinus brumalis]|uniref:F-box domain-containing protein n=1 Tax=Lentinus brumalis TaxID=2498619 RepID=A0A371D6E1_9APHY|nr:hypothetical protein OH76DRAFT_697830 [Polyporus brumalis]
MPYNGRRGHRSLLILDAALSLPPSAAICAWNSARRQLYDYVFLVSTEYCHDDRKVIPELMWMVYLYPLELTDEFIAWIPALCDFMSHLQSERYRTLLSCSLVCSAWLPASRHQLFHELYINSPRQGRRVAFQSAAAKRAAESKRGPGS